MPDLLLTCAMAQPADHEQQDRVTYSKMNICLKCTKIANLFILMIPKLQLPVRVP
jgi:hypothetical protein